MTWRNGSWDRIRIDGKLMPGRVADLVTTPSRDVQSTQTPGTDGPDLKDQGYKGATVALVIEIFKAATAQELIDFIPTISPRQQGALTKPHKIEHPLCAMHNITEVYCESISTPMPSAGVWLVTFSLYQWFKPQDKAKKKTKFTPGDPGGDFGPSGVPAPDPAKLGAKFP